MSVTPPEQRIWWNEPIEKVELVWVIIAFLWGVFMFLFMIAWHFIGARNAVGCRRRRLRSCHPTCGV